MAVTLSDAGLMVGGKLVPVYSGSVHYWRLERERWSHILDQVIILGFQMVETYIPWSIHEIAPGKFDFGERDSRKDVEAFMRLCQEKGLWLIVRPGPLINAELTDFGFPERVLLNPDVQARSAGGELHLDAAWGLHPPHQFPVPSYASETFFAETAGWFDAICPIIARNLAPTGCIVAVQSDNETCYMFHDQPYATDYSVDSICLYRRFLGATYGSIAALNSAYQTSYTAFSEVEPPRDCGIDGAEDLPLRLDWVAYKEYQIRWAVGRFAEMLRVRGVVGVPIFHDIAYQRSTPLDVSRMEAHPDIDWVGMNIYCAKEDYETVAQRMRFLSGATKLPFVPEFGCGLWSHHRQTFEPHDHEFVTLSALMHGLKAINFYMLVERERWQGSPITRHGDFRPDYSRFYERLGKFLSRFPIWEFTRDRATLVLFNYDLGRQAAATTTLNLAHADLLGLPPALFQLDLNLPIESNPREELDLACSESWMGELTRKLTRRNIDFDMADTHIAPEALLRYGQVLVQSLEFMDPDDQVALVGYIEGGGNLVVGPLVPTLDPLLRTNEVLSRLIDSPGSVEVGQGSLTWSPLDALDQAVDALSPGVFRVEAPLELTTFRRGEQALIFIANPTSGSVKRTVEFEGHVRFVDVWNHELDQRAGSEFAVELSPYSVHIYEVFQS